MRKVKQDKPLIVQADRTVLLETESPVYPKVRDALCRFAELESAAEYVHCFRITPLSLWNAAALGMDSSDVKIELGRYSRYRLPGSLLAEIDDVMERYGKLVLTRGPINGELFLNVADEELARELASFKKTESLLVAQVDSTRFRVQEVNRGELKWALIQLGYPVEDRAGFRKAPYFQVKLREGGSFLLRDYQKEAAAHFLGGGASHMGHGVIVLPCGSGKTIVGLAVMARLNQPALILATGTNAVRQWIQEIEEKTHVSCKDIGEYTGERKQVRPITIATYNVMSKRSRGDRRNFPNINRLSKESWGLVIYDEVHLLPAPLFRFTAAIQGTRRLGLTGTLIREDHKEKDVFSLIGPKRYDIPWRQLEEKKWIAEVYLREVRVQLPDDLKAKYAEADKRSRFRIASDNPRKIQVIKELLKRHKDQPTLIIGHYVRQLSEIAGSIGAPMLCGKTSFAERERLYKRFRRGKIPVLVVSKVANFAIDLPEASLAIQVSGTFGSRQEEAQRLGRILRPKDRATFFYTVVSRDTVEQEFSWNRQRFLTEEGYQYEVQEAGGK